MRLCYNIRQMNIKSRQVIRMKSGNLKTIGSSGYSRSQKARIRSRERANKLALTKAKRYLIYALACYVLIQIIKYITYNVAFRGETSLEGFGFLLVAYVQTGLLLLTFIFIILAVFKTLQRLLTEE